MKKDIDRPILQCLVFGVQLGPWALELRSMPVPGIAISLLGDLCLHLPAPLAPPLLLSSTPPLLLSSPPLLSSSPPLLLSSSPPLPGFHPGLCVFDRYAVLLVFI